jgi:hypothetical protein
LGIIHATDAGYPALDNYDASPPQEGDDLIDLKLF